MLARSASRPWLVQIFEVAFSRRMCCSRVWSVSTQHRLPLRSVVSPTIRPGILRTYSSRQAMMPRYGPPNDKVVAQRLALRPRRCRRRSRPGRCSRPRLIGSTTAMARAPRAWAAATIAGDVLELAEEIGVLEDHRGGLVGDGARRSSAAIDGSGAAGTVTSLGSRWARNVARIWRNSGWTDLGDHDLAEPPRDRQAPSAWPRLTAEPPS